MNLGAILSALCAAYVVALVLAERRSSRLGIYVTKPAAAAAFLGVGVAHALAGPGLTPFAAFALAGLALGAAGDVALMLPSDRAFLVGLGLFLLGHLAYVGACAALLAPAEWIGWPAIAPIGGALLALAWLAPHLQRMRVPVVFYVAAIVTMLIAAIAVARYAPYPALTKPGAYVFCAGAALFSASDLAVARQRFVARSFRNKAYGLPAYFAGQLLIAWSLALR